jgi:O-antigen/teichoic acid export membrane protein
MLAKKVLASGGVKVLQLALGLGSSLLLARWLGAAGYGVYSFALALASLLVIPAQLGWPTLLTREVARARHSGDLGVLRGVLRTSMIWTAVASALMLALCLIVGVHVGQSMPGQDVVVLVSASALIPLLALGGLRKCALAGLDRVVLAQALDGVLRPTVMLAAVVCLYFSASITARTAMYAQLAGATAAFAVGSWVLWRTLPAGIRGVVEDTRRSPAWRASMGPLIFVSSAQALTSQADLLVLGFVADTRSVGLYKVALMVGTQVAFASWLVNAVFAPQIVRLHSAGDFAGLRKLMSTGARYVLLVAVPATLAIVLLGKPLLAAALGPAFSDAYVPMAIIAVGQLLGVTAGPVGVLLAMTGHEVSVARVLALTALVSVVLTVLLAKLFGVAGAAVATSVSLVLARSLLRAVARRNMPGIVEGNA